MSDFDADRPWQVHPRVAIRPERFGALLYHFETRKLSFLKERTLLGIVDSLDAHTSLRAAVTAAGVRPDDQGRYLAALGGLAASNMIRERAA
ncbi:MAG: mycofactocin biosynthesis chaperone MftB [Pseudoclavibacter sp.]